MILSENQIHIWHVNLDIESSEITVLKHSLSDAEITRANRIKNPALRVHFINARQALRIILGKYLSKQPSEISLAHDQYGKPFLQNESLAIEFNLSHCQGLCLIAVTLKRKVGIDVEQLGRLKNWVDIVEYSFSQQEQDELHTYSKCEQETAFIRGWTRKEAYTKAIGRGLSYSFTDFSVSLAESSPKLIHDYLNPQGLANWELINIKVNAPYIAALSVDMKGMKLTEFHL